MNRNLMFVAAGAALLAAIATNLDAQQTRPAAAPDACQSLRDMKIADVRFDVVTAVAPQQGWKPDPQMRAAVDVGHALCRLEGVIEKEIGFELWLPAKADWNGKLLTGGVGGDAGTYNYIALARGIKRGYASATTDTGHKASDLNWMLGDPMRLTNFELRAHHRLAEVSKEIIRRQYASAPKYSYFIGCSGGGRQGLKEMQRFPDDYDGIITGAPGPDTPGMTARRMWELLLRDANPGLMSPAQWQLVSQSAIKSCDARDGVTDGVAEDPRACRFDVATLECKAGQAGECLTKDQIRFVKRFYDPMHDESGKKIDDGLLPGVVVDSGRSRLAPATFGQAIRKKSDWDGKDFSLAADLPAINRVMPELKADETDLSSFSKSGGKAIVYQGWMDPAVAGLMTLGWYERVAQKAGGIDAAQQFSRLYMVPGMLHCGGGPGPDQFGAADDAPLIDVKHDMLTALEAWVERGQAPQEIIAAKVTNGQVTRTRPLCPFPQVARYKGQGSTDSAENFACARP